MREEVSKEFLDPRIIPHPGSEIYGSAIVIYIVTVHSET